MIVCYTWEHCGPDTLIQFDDFPGSYVRGRSKEEALEKAPAEIASYLQWYDNSILEEPLFFSESRNYEADLQVCDADSDVLLDCDRKPLTQMEYQSLKALTLHSATCFQQLFDSVPHKTLSVSPARKTFYGQVPATAEEMYRHTKNVNAYYFDQIGVNADNEPDITACRENGFALLEAKDGYLDNRLFDGSFDELWTLRKLFRRFIWHDRIHARAMFRLAKQLPDYDRVQNPFYF